MTLIRGLPGSGKSTFAKALGCFHVEADMYHVKSGVYRFDVSRQKLGHVWCQKTAFMTMESGIDVCVSNTFTQYWEMAPYVEHAKKTGHNVVIVRMTGNYGSIHGVPEETISKMRNRFEDVKGEVFA